MSVTGGSAAVVMAKLLATPILTVVDVALVKTGTVLTLLIVSVKSCVAVPLPLIAVKESAWLPAAAGCRHAGERGSAVAVAGKRDARRAASRRR